MSLGPEETVQKQGYLEKLKATQKIGWNKSLTKIAQQSEEIKQTLHNYFKWLEYWLYKWSTKKFVFQKKWEEKYKILITIHKCTQKHACSNKRREVTELQ